MIRTIACLASGCLLLSSSLWSEEIPVLPKHSVVQALRVAESGDTILVHPGVLVEPIEIRQTVTIASAVKERVTLGPVTVFVDHVVMRNLKFGSSRGAALRISNVKNCVVEQCEIENTDHSILGYGIQVQNVTDLVVSNCWFHGNKSASVVSGSKNTVYRDCEVGPNGGDALIFAAKTSDVLVEDCYIHHTLGEGVPGAHADGIQTFQEVTNITIRNNRIIANQQAMHLEESSEILIEGNTICAVGANAITFGRGAQGAIIRNNLIAFTGLSCLNMSVDDYQLSGNTFMTGHSNIVFSIKGLKTFDSNDNQFFNSVRAKQKALVASDRGWHQTLEDYQLATGFDENSVYADPGFANAPLAIDIVNPKRFETEMTLSFLPLWNHLDHFEIGDTVEVNFDGVKRNVAAIRNEGIVITPPLSQKPTIWPIVTTWGDRDDIELDLSTVQRN